MRPAATRTSCAGRLVASPGATLQEFFDTCEDTETTVVITDGAVEKVTPDGQGRFVADVI